MPEDSYLVCHYKYVNDSSPKYFDFLILFPALVLRPFSLTTLANLHHFLIYAPSFSIQRPLAGCVLVR